jgi:hypothetical protein|nr:MAG TPA: hypothetical protein [Caudoviricetes sp.]
MQTVSQMMAAKREAKKAASIHKKFSNNRYDRNAKSNIAAAQAMNRMALRKGAPQSKEAQIDESIKNLLHYEALVYGYDRISVTVFEKLIRAMRVVSCIYADGELSKTTNKAQAAIEVLREKDSDGLSPDQRREILKPLMKLIQYCDAYDEIVPEKTIDKIAFYCASVQIALYTASLYDRPRKYIQSMFDIINGKSIRAIAKEIGEKENMLRKEVLNSAWHFYRIAECNNALEPADKIPELRVEGYKMLGNFEILADFIRLSTAKFLIPFEENTGISLINYNKFRNDLTRLKII